MPDADYHRHDISDQDIKPRYGSHKRGLNSKNEKALPLAVSVTSGTVADCSGALLLIENLKAEGLIADRAYDTSFVVALPFGQIILCRHSLIADRA